MASAVAQTAGSVTTAGVTATGIAALMMRRIVVIRRRRIDEEHAAAFVTGDAHHDYDTVNRIGRHDLRKRREAEGQPQVFREIGAIAPRPAWIVAIQIDSRM